MIGWLNLWMVAAGVIIAFVTDTPLQLAAGVVAIMLAAVGGSCAPPPPWRNRGERP